MECSSIIPFNNSFSHFLAIQDPTLHHFSPTQNYINSLFNIWFENISFLLRLNAQAFTTPTNLHSHSHSPRIKSHHKFPWWGPHSEHTQLLSGKREGTTCTDIQNIDGGPSAKWTEHGQPLSNPSLQRCCKSWSGIQLCVKEEKWLLFNWIWNQLTK